MNIDKLRDQTIDGLGIALDHALAFYGRHRHAAKLMDSYQLLLNQLNDSRQFNQELVTRNANLKKNIQAYASELAALKEKGQGLGWPFNQENDFEQLVWMCPEEEHHHPHKIHWLEGVGYCEYPDCPHNSRENDDIPAGPAH